MINYNITAKVPNFFIKNKENLRNNRYSQLLFFLYLQGIFLEYIYKVTDFDDYNDTIINMYKSISNSIKIKNAY
jgi:hypothetical protein